VNDQGYMHQALLLAERGRYTVSPNPMVGCILVKNNTIIAQSYHQKAGLAHAEILALKEAGDQAKNATAYVTLEPCCHYGRTPPCTDALIAAGIKKIFIASLDPNPLVAGQGIARLQAAGIEISTGIHESEAKKLNEIFFHYIQTKRPFIIAKWAMSLDGKTITHAEDSRIISDKASQQHSHELRQQVDAILIGSATAIKDDPLLTVRTSEVQSQPLRIILSSQGNLPTHLKLFAPEHPGETLIVTTEFCSKENYAKFSDKNIEVLTVSANQFGQVDLHELLIELGKREITSVLVEGGRHTHESFFHENLVNKTHVYLAPTIIGKTKQKISVAPMQFMQLKNDLHITTYCEEKKNV